MSARCSKVSDGRQLPLCTSLSHAGCIVQAITSVGSAILLKMLESPMLTQQTRIDVISFVLP